MASEAFLGATNVLDSALFRHAFEAPAMRSVFADHALVSRYMSVVHGSRGPECPGRLERPTSHRCPRVPLCRSKPMLTAATISRSSNTR